MIFPNVALAPSFSFPAQAFAQVTVPAWAIQKVLEHSSSSMPGLRGWYLGSSDILLAFPKHLAAAQQPWLERNRSAETGQAFLTVSSMFLSGLAFLASQEDKGILILSTWDRVLTEGSLCPSPGGS